MASYALDFGLCRIKSYQHQKFGTKKIFENKYFFLADEMGAGKTKQTEDAAQFLFQYDLIDTVLVLCPASVRGVWADKELGEIAKHRFESQSGTVVEFHAKTRTWNYGPGPKRLRWIITNYEFVRSDKWRAELIKLIGPKTMLVLDESSAIKNWKAKQTKACMEINKVCGRVVLLNGTPVANNPGDLYSQVHLMHPSILGCKTWYHFVGRYGQRGGWQNKQIVKWINLEDLQKRISPYIIRRLKTDCLDLPIKLPTVAIPVPLSTTTWKIYKEMRDELVAWLGNATASMAPQAIVKAMRLAQITSGLLGGLEDQSHLLDEGEERLFEDGEPVPPGEPVTREIGSEKLDAFVAWFKDQLELDPCFKLLVWCRFKPEVHRIYNALADVGVTTLQRGIVLGSQKRRDREFALRLLDPRTAPIGPAVVIGTPSTGRFGLNLTASHTVIYMSNDYSLMTRAQSEDRVHRPGQVEPVSYYDMIATGPEGQKTIDHMIAKVLQTKKTVADWTTSAWVQELLEE